MNELLDEGGDAGDVIVNLHAQLNMIGGLMVLLLGLSLAVLVELGGAWRPKRVRLAVAGVGVGMACYYGAGIAFAAFEAHRITGGGTFAGAVSAAEPWQGLLLVPAALAVCTGFVAYAAAVWPMTAKQRDEGLAAIANAPAAFTGKVPLRVVRRGPAATAAYELPLGLLGFPGLGWLFAGFPFTASILLLTGPALTWAVVPAAFSPFGQGPLRGVGWKVEFAWLPLLTLVSAGALYRAQARRRSRAAGMPRRPRRGRRSYRTRVSVAAGTLALLLVSLPFVPAVAGVGSSAVRYSYERTFTREVTGQFLSTPRGDVKLFPWQDPQQPYPRDALRIHAADARTLVLRAAAIDEPGAYRLFDLGRGSAVPLAVRKSSPTRLELAPAGLLPSGRYALVSTHEGMFGGKDFSYFTIVPAGGAVSTIGDGGDRTVPAVARSLPPVAAALVALLFALLLAQSFARRPLGSKALWGTGFACFAVAAASEAVAERAGWTPGLFRTYYIAGGVLTVAYLGAGSAWLLLGRRGRDVLLGALGVATAAAIAAVLLAPVDDRLLALTPDGRPPQNSALGGHAFLWAVVLNSAGTLLLVGGSLLSILRRQRVRPNLWIASGAVVVALGTGLSRTGAYSFVYLAELIGIAAMFTGFQFAGERPARVAAVRAERSAIAEATARP